MDTDKGRVRRFSSVRIMEHWIHMVLFFALAASGLCQKFYYLDLCRSFISLSGGIDSVRLLHRGAGVAFACMLTMHLISVIVGMIFYRWQPSMMVFQKDIKDAVHNIKYYLGLRQCHAKCGRYDYKQKFVYWLTITGAAIMLFTGLALWFPAIAAELLTGQVIPAAKVMHANHAFLIFLLIAIWHMYDSIFSPDVFPLDKSVFTGYISIKRMRSEHPLELAAMEGVDMSEPLNEGCEEDLGNNDTHIPE